MKDQAAVFIMNAWFSRHLDEVYAQI
jgi:tetratricopeptide (TPR) repeat protein